MNRLQHFTLGIASADVIILPIIPHVRPDWRTQNLHRVDGIALLIKNKHPALALPRSVEPPCDVEGERFPDGCPL